MFPVAPSKTSLGDDTLFCACKFGHEVSICLNFLCVCRDFSIEVSVFEAYVPCGIP